MFHVFLKHVFIHFFFFKRGLKFKFCTRFWRKLSKDIKRFFQLFVDWMIFFCVIGIRVFLGFVLHLLLNGSPGIPVVVSSISLWLVQFLVLNFHQWDPQNQSNHPLLPFFDLGSSLYGSFSVKRCQLFFHLCMSIVFILFFLLAEIWCPLTCVTLNGLIWYDRQVFAEHFFNCTESSGMISW